MAWRCLSFSNDGQVNVSSTQLPYGQQLFIAPLTHENMHQGSAVFEKINSVLQNNIKSVHPFSNFTLKATEVKENNIASKNKEQFINGGPLLAHNSIEEKISIDSTINETTLYILTKNKDTYLEVISPSEKKYPTQNIKTMLIPKGGLFGGSYLHSISIKRPEKGDWKLHMSSTKEDAYFMFAQFDSNPSISINIESVVKAKTSIPLYIKIENPEIIDLESLKIKIKGHKNEISQTIDVQSLKAIDDNAYINMIQSPDNARIFNMVIEIDGQTKKKTNFKRTEIQSIHVSK
ncbi:hypothetical protein OCF15_17295 [Bacillus cereus]|nr:hypothetical protein [Bacillus cereus]